MKRISNFKTKIMGSTNDGHVGHASLKRDDSFIDEFLNVVHDHPAAAQNEILNEVMNRHRNYWEQRVFVAEDEFKMMKQRRDQAMGTPLDEPMVDSPNFKSMM